LSAIWGHVDLVTTKSTGTSILVVTTTSPLGTCYKELLVREDIDILKGFQRLQFDEILPGEFVVATVGEQAVGGERRGLISSFFPDEYDNQARAMSTEPIPMAG
jgi:hypothetical protein